jgi:hypothetical protein
MSDEDPNRIMELQTEYTQLLHALQTGVKLHIGLEGVGDTSLAGPKHLRVGINSNMIQNSALALLLMRKGVITETEYWETQVELWRKEVSDYEKRLTDLLGREVTLH